MADTAARNRLTDFFREHAHTLDTLDPDAPLDDLEPLRDIVGDARVVALGEGCHFVREFTTARRRILRFLAERCGFTVLAFEFGLPEAVPLDRWLQGVGDESDLAGMEGTTSSGVNGELVHWLRRYNSRSSAPLRFVGVDLPTAAGALRPALDPLADYLRDVDPDAVPLLESAVTIADRFTGRSIAVAAPRWAGLAQADQDALTATLARLLLRMRALEPLYVDRSDRQRFDLARHHLEAACHTDHVFGAMDRMFSGGGLPGDGSVREHRMARSVLWHLDRAAPGTRMVLAAHNLHIQKVPARFDGELAALPMGYYLHRWLGQDYRSLAMTHTADQVPEMHPDGSGEVGFSLVQTPVDPPGPGSVEAALVDSGHGAYLTLTDLRRSPRDADDPLPDRIRGQSSELPMAVPDAFDAVLSTPTSTTYVTTVLSEP